MSEAGAVATPGVAEGTGPAQAEVETPPQPPAAAVASAAAPPPDAAPAEGVNVAHSAAGMTAVDAVAAQMADMRVSDTNGVAPAGGAAAAADRSAEFADAARRAGDGSRGDHEAGQDAEAAFPDVPRDADAVKLFVGQVRVRVNCEPRRSCHCRSMTARLRPPDARAADPPRVG